MAKQTLYTRRTASDNRKAKGPHRKIAMAIRDIEKCSRDESVRRLHAAVDSVIAHTTDEDIQAFAMMQRVMLMSVIDTGSALPKSKARRLAVSLEFWAERSMPVGSYILYENALGIRLRIGDITLGEYRKGLRERVKSLKVQTEAVLKWCRKDERSTPERWMTVANRVTRRR